MKPEKSMTDYITSTAIEVICILGTALISAIIVISIIVLFGG